MNKLTPLLFTLLLASPFAQAHNANYCISCERDSHGHIKRSLEAKHEFKREHPCPANGKTKGRC
jgi:glucose-6-phosphate dehydrogenase assembly protein OpcA